MDKLTVDEINMKKDDLRYPLTPEQYANMKVQILADYRAQNTVSATDNEIAWLYTVDALNELFASVLRGLGINQNMYSLCVSELSIAAVTTD